MTGKSPDELLDHARNIIRDLRTRLAAAEAPRREPIAIVGMAFRFPGAGSDQEQLWTMFADGRDAVREVPADRWDGVGFDPASLGNLNTFRGAFLDDVRRFDAAFFDITPREAVRMDPQQRLFLETAWHALENAGLPRQQILGSDTGVFVGVHNLSSDYQWIQLQDLESLDPWSATGTAHDMIAGRLAYWLDLHGPAIVVNTACSSSLAAVHLACRSLRAGDCSAAVVAGINLLLSPASTIAASQLQLLSPDGHCRAFDARAKGMGRGEGCGVVVLKKLSAALQAGDRVLAVIRGSAMNQDGRTNGLTAPSGPAQQRVLRHALAEAGVQPADVGYVETHGTGTALGDPIEVEAIASVLGGGTRRSPCSLGALKANLAHLEGAAGIAGLIKTVMVLRRRWLPPVANLGQLNPHIALEGTGIEIPRSGHAWPENQPHFAGVSSFGWSGTNVHVVLEEAAAPRRGAAGSGPWPVVVSAQTPEVLRRLVASFADRLDAASPAELPAISYTSAVRRTALPCRVAVEGTQPREIANRLRQRLEDSALGNGSAKARQDGRLVQWENGSDVDWGSFFPEPIEVVDLPLYPFQGRDFWVEKNPKSRGSRPIQESPATASSDAPAPDDWFYSLDLLEKNLENHPPQPPAEPVAWILLGRETELSRQMASAVRNRGERLFEGFAAGSPQSNLPMDQRLLDLLSQCDGTGPRHVLYFPGGDEAATQTAEALRVVQALLKSGQSARLWFVVENQHPPANVGEEVSSALRGLSRVAGLEHPERIGGMIVADSVSSVHVCREIEADAGEDHVLLHAGHRWVPRLNRERPLHRAPIKLRGDRCYLVTGAFGAIGLDVAAWLIDAGARHLLLAGRRDPALMGKPQLLQRLEAWRRRGLDVQTCVCDVADTSQVDRMLAEVDAGGVPLAGVVHAAASARFSPVDRASADDVQEIFRAKLEGARILDRSTRMRSLDFFVLFGSAAATLGLRNGAVYAAANGALEDVVKERRALGLPALCVEWGWWASDHTGAQPELIENSGFMAMQAKSALAGLAALIQTGRNRGLIANIDWRILGPALALRGRDALVSPILRSTEETAHGEGGPVASWIESLRSLPYPDQRDQILDRVTAEARAIFGMAPQDPLDHTRGLFAMGMDSLMAVRLKRRLEQITDLRLPGTVTLTCPTLAALAEYLQTRLCGEPRATASAAHHPPDPDLAKLVAMDEEQARVALEKELAAVQQTLARETT